VHDVSRQLTLDELAELFEGRTRLVEELAKRPDPLGEARDVIAQLGEEDKLEALNAHPAIGAKNLSARSAAEQGDDSDPEVLTELAYLNQVYEEKFGFRFVVFVNRRPKEEILDGYIGDYVTASNVTLSVSRADRHLALPRHRHHQVHREGHGGRQQLEGLGRAQGKGKGAPGHGIRCRPAW